MKKRDFLTLRKEPKQKKPTYHRVSGYLYGLEMPGDYQLPVGIYCDKTGGGKQWHVVDLLTGLSWAMPADRLTTLEKAYRLVEERVQRHAFFVLKKQPQNVIPENRALYATLLGVGEFAHPLKMTPLRPENTPQSCVTFDSEGAERA